MPIEESDQAFMHIQWISESEFKVIAYKRREIAPFDFVARVIYSCSIVNGNQVINSIEYLDE